MAEQGVGARLLRKEDDRLMRGRGEFVADIRLTGLQDVAFVRSPLAHARIRGISIPPQYKDSVFTAADLDGVKPIRAVSGLPGFKISEQPVLATDKVRQVGELAAMCVGSTRAEAEDIAASVELDLEELPAVYDMLEARARGSALVHEHWGDNVFLETFVDVNIEKALEPTPEHVEGQIRVKVGPIAAEFRGQAEIERDESSYSGKITGAGNAIRSNSATRGVIGYRLLSARDGQSTEVAVTIGYTLTGMLAQFGRPSIVQDVAARLTAAFAQNLEAGLRGKATAGLDAGSLIFSVVAGRLQELFRRLFGSRS